MSTWIDCWEDEEPARRYDERESAWEQLSEEHEPPDPDECPACDGQGCLVCAARPEGGER